MKNYKPSFLIISLILNVVFLSFGIYQYNQAAKATKQLKEQKVIIEVMRELNQKAKQQEEIAMAQNQMLRAQEQVKTAEEAKK